MPLRFGWSAPLALLLVISACAAPPPPPGPAPRPAIAPATSVAPVPAPGAAALRLAHDSGLAAWAATLVAEWQTAGVAVRVVADDPDAPLRLTTTAATEHATAVVGWDYTILAQPWLDAPLALSTDTARRAATSEDPALTPLRRLDRLNWGLVPVPVDGVLPDPRAIAGGRYPLASPVLLTLRPGGPAAAAAAYQLATAAGAAARRSGLGDGGPAITLAAVGDIMLARGVANMMRGYGWEYPADRVADQLVAADIAFANLESAVGTGGTPLLDKGIWFRAPPEAMAALRRAGIDVVTLANNHTMDYGPDLLLETLALLEQDGIGYVGGGRHRLEARRPLVLERGGQRLAFLGYSTFAPLTWNAREPRPLLAGPDRPGTIPPDPEWLAADIAAARALADVVVVAMLWGEEYQNQPTPAQVALGRRAVELGADIVLGSHPHAVQGFERHGSGFIAWSLGNFIMDQDSLGEIPRESMLLEFTFYPGGGRSVRLHPLYIAGFRPTWPDAARSAALRAKLHRLSGWGATTPSPAP